MGLLAAAYLLTHVLGSALSDTWQKVLLTDAVKQGAVCLDGSPGGYYIRQGDPKKWIVFHQGGGWCTSDALCARRADCTNSQPGCIMGGSCCALGSSTVWGPTYTDKYEGSQLFSMPEFANHTAVYAMYCDGGSWTGNVSDPVKVSGKTLYYRGRLLLDAMLDSLLQNGLSQAEQLLYGGCSAGGLTAYLHSDYVASRVPKTVKTLAIADAMFSLNTPNYKGENTFPMEMKWVYSTFNSAASVNDACFKHYGAADAWRCMFGGNVAQFVSTPLFVLNSKYDTWQEKAIIGAPDVITNCPPNVTAFWVNYGENMVAKLNALPEQHGTFVSNCPAHCQTGSAGWGTTTINGTSMGDAFLSWYQVHTGAHTAVSDSPSSSGTHRWVEKCDVKPCSPDKC